VIRRAFEEDDKARVRAKKREKKDRQMRRRVRREQQGFLR
jgi:hypothetical protein